MEQTNINESKQDDYVSPLKSIRKFCLECVGSSNEVKRCSAEKCCLFPYRFGKNPFTKRREYTDEQKAELAERMKIAREAKK